MGGGGAKGGGKAGRGEGGAARLDGRWKVRVDLDVDALDVLGV